MHEVYSARISPMVINGLAPFIFLIVPVISEHCFQFEILHSELILTHWLHSCHVLPALDNDHSKSYLARTHERILILYMCVYIYIYPDRIFQPQNQSILFLIRIFFKGKYDLFVI